MSQKGETGYRDIGPDFVPRPRGRVVCEVMDDIAVLYDEPSGVCHRLNPTATLIWSQLDGSASVARLADEAHRRFQGDRSQIEADVVALVRHFGELGLLDGVASRSEEVFADESERP